MQKSGFNPRILVIGIIILLAALSRLLPHPANFTPVGAMALFGAAYYRKAIFAFLVPFAALWISDLLLNNILLSQFYDGFVWMGNLWVYLGFAIIIVLGRNTLSKWTPKSLLGVTLTATLLWFLVVNFGVWMGPFSLYGKSLSGLFATYAAAIPYDLKTLAGNLVYTAVLFGGFEWLKSRIPALQKEYAQ
ncbi:MAG: hypothetical protein HKN16_08930 [Saprospiraceae bacterium]|nr:hypothetical protein [Saprospiraceae bacterium]